MVSIFKHFLRQYDDHHDITINKPVIKACLHAIYYLSLKWPSRLELADVKATDILAAALRTAIRQDKKLTEMVLSTMMLLNSTG